MGCHGHGYSRHGCWQGDCWNGPGHGYGSGWDDEPWYGEPYVREPYARRVGPRPYAASRISPETAAAQLEAHLATLRDEMRALEAELAEMKGERERAARPDREV